MQSITSVTPTLCKLMRVPLPQISTTEAVGNVLDVAEVVLKGSAVEKCFVYAPDAIGEALFRDYSAEFEPVIKIAPVQVVLRSMVPSVTPVCFASMFTGTMPEAHGISQYNKPVLRCDTIFDALLREKRRVAIVAVNGCSIALIFQERPLDYFIEQYDGEVNSRLLQIFDDDKSDYDFVLVYNQEYDDALHRTTPRSSEALRAMQNHIRSFEQLAGAFLRRYRGYTRLVVFSPDHGGHVNPAGKGTHGLDIPEDMEVRSFWGIYNRSI